MGKLSVSIIFCAIWGQIGWFIVHRSRRIWLEVERNEYYCEKTAAANCMFAWPCKHQIMRCPHNGRTLQLHELCKLYKEESKREWKWYFSSPMRALRAPAPRYPSRPAVSGPSYRVPGNMAAYAWLVSCRNPSYFRAGR